MESANTPVMLEPPDSTDTLEKPLPRPPYLFGKIRHYFALLYHQRLRSLHQKTSSYRFVIFTNIWIVNAVLGVNLIVTISVVSKLGVKSGFGTIYDGNCDKVKSLTFWIHLGINVLSTLLVGASNYCMQCLSSPTRGEIDSAHRKGVWLDIGVPGMRNLRMIPKYRATLWALLALTSVPVNLFYNSAIFSRLQNRQYSALVVPSSFVSLPSSFLVSIDDRDHVQWKMGNADIAPVLSPAQASLYDHWKTFQTRRDTLVNLTRDDCVRTYTVGAIATYADLFIVSNSTNFPDATTETYLPLWSNLTSEYFRPQSGDTKSFNDLLIDQPFNSSADYITSEQYIGNAHEHFILYCLAQPVTQQCKLQFSLVIMVIVITCNFIKSSCMAFLIFWKQDQKPLVTLGDAIASFLDAPDLTTIGKCTAGREQFEKFWERRCSPLKWKPRQIRWWQAISLWRWLFTLALTFVIITVAVVWFLAHGTDWSGGFGKPNRAMSTRDDESENMSLLLTALISNVPQLLASSQYFGYNSCFTCMLLAHEWSQYCLARKSLRVSSPTGIQRTSFWLQLPYRYSVPLLCGTALLHWLISQSIFPIRVDGVDSHGNQVREVSLTAIGFSNSAIFTSLMFLISLLALTFVTGRQKFKGEMPLAGYCSAAISAACHPPEGDLTASLKPVKYGEIEQQARLSPKGVAFGHCSFTSFRVKKPTRGKLYAGLASDCRDETGGDSENCNNAK